MIEQIWWMITRAISEIDPALDISCTLISRTCRTEIAYITVQGDVRQTSANRALHRTYGYRNIRTIVNNSDFAWNVVHVLQAAHGSQQAWKIILHRNNDSYVARVYRRRDDERLALKLGM